jgi:hypothetical protein
MGIQNVCITLPMNKAPHGKEHLFHLRIINSTKIEHFVRRQGENYTILWLNFLRGNCYSTCKQCTKNKKPVFYNNIPPQIAIIAS